MTTCSPRTRDWAVSLGADGVFDYSSLDAVDQIRGYVQSADVDTESSNELTLIMDCIGNEATAKFCVGCFVPGPGEGKKCIYAPLLIAPLPSLPDPESVQHVFRLAFTCFGYAFKVSGSEYPASAEDREFMTEFFRDYVQELLDRKLLRLMPVEVRRGTWEDVIGGIAEIRAGGVKSKKLVWRVADP